MDFGWLETACVFGGAVAVFIWANVVGRRPADPLNPRMWSPELVMGAAAVVAIVMLAHMLSLATGRPFQGGGL